jgi:hypothetical protein
VQLTLSISGWRSHRLSAWDLLSGIGELEASTRKCERTAVERPQAEATATATGKLSMQRSVVAESSSSVAGAKLELAQDEHH